MTSDVRAGCGTGPQTRYYPLVPTVFVYALRLNQWQANSVAQPVTSKVCSSWLRLYRPRLQTSAEMGDVNPEKELENNSRSWDYLLKHITQNFDI